MMTIIEYFHMKMTQLQVLRLDLLYTWPHNFLVVIRFQPEDSSII